MTKSLSLTTSKTGLLRSGKFAETNLLERRHQLVDTIDRPAVGDAGEDVASLPERHVIGRLYGHER
jgi:hypothetical protein